MKRKLEFWLRYELKYRASKLGERALIAIVWRLPTWLVMLCYIRVGAYATTGEYENTVVPEISMMEALDRWPAS